MNNVCAYCNLFIPFETDILLTKVYLEFVLAIEAAVIVNNDPDCYERTDNNFHFCNICYDIIVEKQIPKFESANCINVLLFKSTLTFIGI